MNNRFKNIDEYIKNSPEEVRPILEKIRRTIRKTVPGAAEAISYQMPTFKLNGRNLVHFAAWKGHIGLYPLPSGMEAFQKELVSYEKSKGSVRFPLDRPIPYDLIAKIAEFRTRELQKK